MTTGLYRHYRTQSKSLGKFSFRALVDMKVVKYSILPDKAYARELTRPWKLITFCIAMSWLLYGALFFDIADWDVGVTFLMGGLTYLMAPWSVYIILSAIRYRPKYWLLHIMAALLVGFFVVDWVYMAYHEWAGNQTFRVANFRAPSPLYLMAGVVWLYRGSMKDIFENLKKLN
jgi:hypothetical protein